MGCVGSKKEQKALGKATGDSELDNPAHSAHYVKDPTTTNSRGVSRTLTVPVAAGRAGAALACSSNSTLWSSTGLIQSRFWTHGFGAEKVTFTLTELL